MALLLPATRPAAPSTVAVSSNAIRDNTALLRSRCGTPVMAVVKAGGFGLGAVTAARAALAGGADELGVATCTEAIELRRAGIEAPILSWMLHDDAPIRDAVALGVRLAPTSTAQLARVAEAALSAGVVAEIEIEVESGMNRSGAPRAQWRALFEAASATPGVWVAGIWTHLSGAAPEHFTEPLAQLDEALALARSLGLAPRRHAGASLAATVDPRTRLDIVRLGASIFGIEPVPDRPVGLTPVATWETRVSQTRDARGGQTVGYGRTPVHTATRLALIPVGYADGISRRASADRHPMTVSIGGRRFPLIGAVSMDQSVIEVGDAPVMPGDRVVLLGDPARGEPSLSEWADALGTIPQEVLTAIGPRVARREVDA
ncbi:alanine racemase [Microbacterium sp. 179-I 3D2 NHS]|uniref:alanine racemase n=1 Tax=Microbacterium sp. 179-I 3D2 NHS TaxID=3235178 RepID=UPI0039A1D7A9